MAAHLMPFPEEPDSIRPEPTEEELLYHAKLLDFLISNLLLRQEKPFPLEHEESTPGIFVMSSLLRQLLAQRFGQLPEWAAAKMQAASVETLEAWGRRIFEARSLDEIFV